MKNFTYKDIFEMYKATDDDLWQVVGSMTVEQIDEIIADAQRHDLVGTYDMCMWLTEVSSYIEK